MRTPFAKRAHRLHLNLLAERMELKAIRCRHLSNKRLLQGREMDSHMHYVAALQWEDATDMVRELMETN